MDELKILCYRVPTDKPESDGTFEWTSTTVVVVEAVASSCRGLGFSYASLATATFTREFLAQAVVGCDAFSPEAAWQRMAMAVRNQGRAGVSAMALSAVDTALWDLKARLLELPLASLLGVVRLEVPVYGSGGFTSYSLDELQRQLSGWVEQGIGRVKMKVGREPDADAERVRAARQAIGDAELFVDANGAYARKQALGFAERFGEEGVSWFEEPVSSTDLEGLRMLRDRSPGGMDVSAGEYGYDLAYFRRMLAAQAVDVIQADLTRCGGITGFLRVAALCDAFDLPLSAHTAPALSLQVACALPQLRHIEYFFDHARIEEMIFDGFRPPEGGTMRPNLGRDGHGLQLRRQTAHRYAV
ncbi:MAG TPA: enolase C-terminal domain-like protein [Trueperaceae bacterium]